MDHKEILLRSAKTVTTRGEQYGAPSDTFNRAATIATAILGEEYSAYEVAIIIHAVKLSRIKGDRRHLDNYEDGINFLAFAAEFVGATDKKAPSAPGLREDMEDLARLVPRAVAQKQADSVRPLPPTNHDFLTVYGEHVVAEALAHKHEEDGA